MRLQLGAVEAVRDWRTFVNRAQFADPDAAMRLSVQDSTLVLTCAPLAPAGIGDSMPLVLGMRMLSLADSSSDGLDVVVPTAALLDRFARALNHDETAIDVPPQNVTVPWSGIAPPRRDWHRTGEVPVESLREAAQAGIEEITVGAPQNSGGHAVSRLRRLVWSRALPTLPDVACAAAFGLEALGFLPREGAVQIHSAGQWRRVSTPVGHVLTRALAAGEASTPR